MSSLIAGKAFALFHHRVPALAVQPHVASPSSAALYVRREYDSYHSATFDMFSRSAFERVASEQSGNILTHISGRCLFLFITWDCHSNNVILSQTGNTKKGRESKNSQLERFYLLHIFLQLMRGRLF